MSNVFDRDTVIAKLKDKVCTVTFTKRDGTKRVMKATLMENVVEPLRSASNNPRIPNLNQVCCIDTEKDAWRSFNLDTLISID